MPDYTAEECARLHTEGMTWAEIGKLFGKGEDAPRKLVARAGVEEPEIPDEEDPTFTTTANVAEATYCGPLIHTLDGLIDACKVDRDVWRVLDHEIKVYPGWCKRERSDLVFDEGRISGHLTRGGIETEQLFSLHAKFVRRQPIAIEPVVVPVKAAAHYPAPTAPKRDQAIIDLFLGDPHIGYWRDVHTGRLTPMHDRRAIDIAVQIAHDLQPDRIELLGDWFDAARQSSSFRQEPEFYWTTQPAINEGHWWLARFCDAAPRAEKRLYEGNHDVRIINHIKDHAQWAYRLKGVADVYPALSLPRLLDLDALQIRWVGGYPKDAYYCPSEWVKFEHGRVARVAGNTGRHVINGSKVWKFYGHIHRQEVVTGVCDMGNHYQRACFVSAGHLAHADRLPGYEGGEKWGKGLGIAYYSPSKPEVSVELISIEDGRAIWRGRVYEGRDCVDGVRASFPDFNWGK